MAQKRVKKAKVAPVTNGLIGNWGFGEGKGNVAKDTSGNRLHGEVCGAKFVKAGKKFALYFCGFAPGVKGAYVACGRPTLLNPRKAVTYEAWIKPEGQDTSNLRGIMGHSRETNGLQLNPEPRVRLHIMDLANACWSKPIQNKWTHAMATFDGRKLKVYINGELSSEADSKEDHCIEAKEFYIGYVGTKAATDDEGYFRGWIGEARLYKRALTAAEVKKNFEATCGNYPGVK